MPHLPAKASSSALAVRTGVEGREQDVLRPSSVPIEVRRASWDRLWQILLRDLPNEDVGQQESEPSSQPAETNEAPAHATSGKEVAPVIA
jgi:hypothetical protein